VPKIYVLALTAACCLVAAPAHARSKRPKLMLLGFPPDKAFELNEQKAFDDFEAGALRDQGFDVLTNADVAAVLGVEKQKQLMGCSESNCLTELGGAIGADYIVRGNLASVGDRVALTMTLIDSRGAVVNEVRSSKIGKGSGQVLDAIEKLVPGLVAPVTSKLAPPAAAATPGAAAAVPAGTATPSVSAPVEEPASSPVPRYLLWGVGAAGLVGSGVFYGLAWSSSGQLKTATLGGTPGANLSQLRSSTQTNTYVSAACLGVGVVGLAVGTLLYLMSPSSAAPAQTPGAVAFQF
jgi:hypothetical protein